MLVVRASNSSWARRYSISKLIKFRKSTNLRSVVTDIQWWVWDQLSQLLKFGDFFSEKLRRSWDPARGQHTCLYVLCVTKYSELMFLIIFSIFRTILGAQGLWKLLCFANLQLLRLPRLPKSSEKSIKWSETSILNISLHIVRIDTCVDRVLGPNSVSASRKKNHRTLTAQNGVLRLVNEHPMYFTTEIANLVGF